MKKGELLTTISVLILAIACGILISRKSPLRHRAQLPEPTQSRTITLAAPPQPALAQPSDAVTDPDPFSDAALTNALFRTAESSWQAPVPEEAFARFHDWAENYLKATEAQKVELENEGHQLARSRREALRELIQTDPQKALELAIPLRVREGLPAEIAAELEQRVSSRGRLAVLGAFPESPDQAGFVPTFRTASLGAGEFKAFVYGRRLGEPTRENVPVNGIAIDNLLAVGENPLRVLDTQEAAAAHAKNPDPICAVSGKSSTINNDEVVAESGGQILFLCGKMHAVQLNSRLTAAESGGPGDPSADGSPEQSTWTEGTKKVILIRVDFSDLIGAPYADATGIALISNLNVFYTEMSYGRAGFAAYGAGSDMTPTFRMPQPAAYYGTNNYYDQLRADARSAATAAGYTLSNFDRDVICMGAVTGFGWAGLAYVGAAGAWLRSSFTTGVAGHELGHNWGLNHANFWDTTSLSVIGPGTSIEYGDSFDTMGSASAGNNHFNARYKNYLNWLQAGETLTVTSNGTYRIAAHDNQTSTGLRGLKVVKNSGTNYWIEFRQKFTSNKWLMNGAGLRWAGNGNERSQLLDTTVGTSDGKNDSAVVIGRTFSDRVTGIHITPIGKGGTSPESLDVVVNLGLFPSDQAPALAVNASALTGAVGATLTFTATASDPDGDALAYYWDFGDGNFGTNGPVAAKSWAAAGEYVVRCIVSDMKGGEAVKSLTVTIGAPTTYRISGYVGTGSAPVQGVRVYASSTRMAWTDSDGTYTIVGLPPGTYTINAVLENYTLTSSFTNPVIVGPNAAGVDFAAASQSSSAAPTITGQPGNQTVNPGSSATFSVTATGTAPLRYQWRFNGASIAGATLSSYTKTNAQASDAGNYSVVVTNVAGTATSANGVLAVNTPASITGQPQSQTVIAGNNASFNVTASGTAPLTYQWRFYGTNLPGATASTLSRLNVQLADAGNYSVVVANALGSATSTSAVLTVNFTLSASASAGGTVSRNPDLSSYPANTVVTLTAVPVSNFPFVGWSGDASGTNDPLQVTMTANKAITANFSSPVPDLIVDNPAATFTGSWTLDTAAPDEYGPDYRWTASTPGGSATATAQFTPNFAVGGRYDVYAWFPTITKSTTTVPFTIIAANGSTPITVDQTVNEGGWVLLASAVDFDRGTNGYVRIANNTGGGGKNIAADAVRWVYSANQVIWPPVITLQPTNRTVVAGQAASFVVAATGTGPLRCQWCWNNAEITGATNDIFALTPAQAGNAGNYFVVITNSAGAVTSLVATLTVSAPPMLSNLGVSTNGAPRFALLGNAGERYAVQFSSNLLNWQDVSTVTNLTGSVQFTDTVYSNYSQRYYRCRLLP